MIFDTLFMFTMNFIIFFALYLIIMIIKLLDHFYYRQTYLGILAMQILVALIFKLKACAYMV